MTKEQNNPAVKNIPQPRVSDMRPPHQRNNNLVRDNPRQPSNPKSLVRS